MRIRNIFFMMLLSGMMLASFNQVTGQVLEVTSEITPEGMVELLIGSGLSYDNVVYTGSDNARGAFWGGPGNIGVSDGIILTSGNVNVAPGPNNNGGAGANADQGGDIDLTTIAGASTFDACVLEFDFVPEYENVWFHYVFCSEEYHEYVNQFNDAFGFFISGPGITGPFSGNSENIALIPLTTVPVTINTVNCGNPYNCAESCTNCQFFVNNNSNFTQYDAFTTVLMAWIVVEPMQTYHIKLAVGDGLDHAFDSGVFLQASSFCSGPVTGIDQGKTDSDRFSVFPVPSGDFVNITSNGQESITVELIGQDGRKYSEVTGKSQVTLDLSNLPAGIYFIRITDKNGVSTQKIYRTNN